MFIIEKKVNLWYFKVMKISPEIVLLYQKIEQIYKSRTKIKKEEDKIEVETITSHLASLYEKLRNSVDFKEIHLLRRFAIERNLKRRFVLEMLKPSIARGLLEELSRAQYLPNKTIPEYRIKDVEKIIAKYQELFLMINDLYPGNDATKYSDWLLSVEACEIDMLLNPEDVEDSVIEAMYEITKPRVKLKGDQLSIKEKNIQLYLAIHRSLVKSDDTIVSYHLLNLYLPDWLEGEEKTIKLMADKLPAIYRTIQHHLNHPYQNRILKSIKETVVTFQVLYELILDNKEETKNLLVDPDVLRTEAKLLIHQKYKKIRTRIQNASVRAIIYIFITKVLLAVILELPYEMYIINELNYGNIAINVIFPPLLMFLITLTIRPPHSDNTLKILENLHNTVYDQPEKSILCQLTSKYRQNFGFQVFYQVMYTLLYVLVFGSIVYILWQLDFNLLSGGLFLFFLTAVSFFGIRIRSTAKELEVSRRKEGFMSFITNFFALPVVGVGRWLANRFKKINVFAFIMDYIIEAPFKLFITAFEDWIGFMREKKEEVFHNNK